jgi:hypothetical protein
VPVQSVPGSYLYSQYATDPDLQGFVNAYNTLAQNYLTWFNTVDLPVYTSPTISGTLLDWVALGLYGFVRPVFPYGSKQFVGPFNTVQFNSPPPFNGVAEVGATGFYATTDDIFKRAITWHFYKGDGNRFNMRWLKRRCIRFLVGTNGTDGAPDTAATYAVGVTIANVNQVTINVVTGGDINATNAVILQSGIASGALETPFQFQFLVTINGVAPSGWTFGVSAFGTGGF